MGNMIDYIKANHHQSFDQLPLNPLDIACLNELGYISYRERLPQELNWQQFFNFRDLLAQYGDRLLERLDFLVTPERLELLSAVLEADRFADLEIGYYVNDVSDEYEKQFAAMLMRIPTIAHTQVIFRGTDDSLVGWKEDFNMTYRSTIPAQFSAKEYLEMILDSQEDSVIISGHSKGGNLALYASTFVSSERQARIKEVYVFDAPGLRQNHLETDGYQHIKTKISAYRPYESIVGVMLPNDFSYLTVDSKEAGFNQHKMNNWQIDNTDFLLKPDLSPMSQGLEKAIEDWRTSYSSQELKLIFDTFFDLFFEANITSLNDLMTKPGQGFWEVLSTYNHLEKDKKEFLEKAFVHLFLICNKYSAEQAWTSGTEKLQELLSGWQNQLLDQTKELGDRKRPMSLPDFLGRFQSEDS